MSGYGQFCPVAKAMELLDERWTMLVVRELLLGQRALQRSAPRRAEDVAGAAVEAAEDVDPGRCGRTRRGRRPHRLLADTVRQGARRRRRVARRLGCALDRRTRRRGSRPPSADVGHPPHHPHRGLAAHPHHDCLSPRRGAAEGVTMVAGGRRRARPTCATSIPGFEVTGTVETDLRTLTRIWRGDVGWSHALLDGSVAVSGPADVRRAIPSWIGQGSLAAVPRPA